MKKKVKADFAEILRFAKQLDDLADSLSKDVSIAKEKLESYNQFHKDEKYDQLHELLLNKYEQMIYAGNRMVEYAKHLRGLARILKIYHKIKV